MKGERERAEQAERLRLYYVAMTRAMERLIVSGSVGPRDDTAEETPIAWVLGRLGLEEEVRERAAEEPYEIERGGARVLLRIDRGQQAAMPVVDMVTDAASEPEVGQLALFEGVGRAVAAPGAAASLARRDPRAAAPSRLAAVLQRHLPVRALLLPLLRRAGGRNAADSVGGRGG